MLVRVSHDVIRRDADVLTIIPALLAVSKMNAHQMAICVRRGCVWVVRVRVMDILVCAVFAVCGLQAVNGS